MVLCSTFRLPLTIINEVIQYSSYSTYRTFIIVLSIVLCSTLKLPLTIINKVIQYSLYSTYSTFVIVLSIVLHSTLKLPLTVRVVTLSDLMQITNIARLAADAQHNMCVYTYLFIYMNVYLHYYIYFIADYFYMTSAYVRSQKISRLVYMYCVFQ